jgi:hypothetical protein
MAWWLSAAYVVAHGVALVLLPAHAQTLSYSFLIGAPLLAAAACVRRSLGSEAVVGWVALAVGMVLWAGGMAMNMYQEVGLGNADSTPGISMLLYVLYGVPLTFAMAHPRHAPWFLSVIDGAMALLLGYLFFVYTFSFVTITDASDAGVDSLRRMFDIENLFIAGFALLRWLASEDRSRRAFFGALSLFACVYLVVAAYINHFGSETSYGSLVDLLIDVPFLVLAVVAWRRSPVRPVEVSRRLALGVRAGSPLILAISLLVMSALLVRAHPMLAVAGFAFATLGSGLRSVLMQVRSLEQQDRLDVLARVDGLTGVANRRQFDQVLQAEWNRSRRSGQGIALLMVDIDHFKVFNDRYGHPLGDACLRAVAAALAGCAVARDRCGGALRRRGVRGGAAGGIPRGRAGLGRDHAHRGRAAAAELAGLGLPDRGDHQHRGGAAGQGHHGGPGRAGGRHRRGAVRSQATGPHPGGGGAGGGGAGRGPGPVAPDAGRHSGCGHTRASAAGLIARRAVPSDARRAGAGAV